jgi:hypothetical protein
MPDIRGLYLVVDGPPWNTMSRLTRSMNARSMFWKLLKNVVHSGNANTNRRVANNSRINSTTLHINHTRSHYIMNPIIV